MLFKIIFHCFGTNAGGANFNTRTIADAVVLVKVNDKFILNSPELNIITVMISRPRRNNDQIIGRLKMRKRGEKSQTKSTNGLFGNFITRFGQKQFIKNNLRRHTLTIINDLIAALY